MCCLHNFILWPRQIYSLSIKGLQFSQVFSPDCVHNERHLATVSDTQNRLELCKLSQEDTPKGLQVQGKQRNLFDFPQPSFSSRPLFPPLVTSRHQTPSPSPDIHRLPLPLHGRVKADPAFARCVQGRRNWFLGREPGHAFPAAVGGDKPLTPAHCSHSQPLCSSPDTEGSPCTWANPHFA